ncbi:MAG: bifunctional hydroxymethylpyrimidine kinase/phosphomethylpyrimidine kinase [Alphaproteobacteria bacterium]
MRGRVLIVAGSDSSGGAGIQADIKTVTALGGYAATAITALTAQNTKGVLAVMAVPPEFVVRQMEAVLTDIGADCIKTGMLHTAETIEAVAAALARSARGIPLVVDPVMVAKGGAKLLAGAAVDALKRDLAVKATILTPNVPEAEALTGLKIRDLDDMKHAAEMVHTLGPKAVLLKGGHIADEVVYDVLATADGVEVYEHPWIETPHTHGTGCTLASAIATGLAQKLTIYEAVVRARAYVLEAIRSAPGLGRGHGPLNHVHSIHAFER